MIEAAATNTMIPSSAAEKYSALVWPKWWLWSAGLAAMVSETSATMAATRLTIDSAASDSRPTESVIAHALPLSRTVSTAVPIANQAYFLRSGLVAAGLSIRFIFHIVPCIERTCAVVCARRTRQDAHVAPEKQVLVQREFRRYLCK